MDRWRAALVVGRDLVTSTVAIWGIVNEERSGAVHWELLVVYTAMLGIPTALNVWAIRTATPPPPERSSTDTGTSRSSSALDSAP
jgi:hypothetical protein